MRRDAPRDDSARRAWRFAFRGLPPDGAEHDLRAQLSPSGPKYSLSSWGVTAVLNSLIMAAQCMSASLRNALSSLILRSGMCLRRQRTTLGSKPCREDAEELGISLYPTAVTATVMAVTH